MFPDHVSFQVEFPLRLEETAVNRAGKLPHINTIVLNVDIKRDFLPVNFGAPLTSPAAKT